MGGALILIGIGVVDAAVGRLEQQFRVVVMVVMLAFGAIGWLDDWSKMVRRIPRA